MASNDAFMVRLDKDWSQFTPAERQAFLEAVSDRAFGTGKADGDSDSDDQGR